MSTYEIFIINCQSFALMDGMNLDTKQASDMYDKLVDYIECAGNENKRVKRLSIAETFIHDFGY